MPDYKALYLMLFHVYTDVVDEIEQQNFGLARQTIIEAQQRAEELSTEE